MNDFESKIRDKFGETILRDRIFLPNSEGDLAEIVLIANEFRIPLYNANDFSDGYQISLEKMNRILEISEEDFLLVTEAGTTLNACKNILSQKNLFFPLEASEIFLASAITNSLFPSLKYYILGMRAISPTGSILRLGGRTAKNVTGYNILGMFFGSRGIFGIPTQVTLKLTPLPTFDYTEKKEMSRRQPEILLRLKRELDPNNILNRNILGEI